MRLSATWAVAGEYHMNIESTKPGTLIALARVSRVMSPEDADDLKWYFRRGALRQLQQSNWGAALERMSRFAYGADPCTACGGDKKTQRAGSGFEARKRPGSEQDAMLKLLDIEVPDLTGKVCSKCKGFGIIARKKRRRSRGPLTARPTGSSKRGGDTSVSIDTSDLARLGRLIKRVEAARGVWPGAIDILEAKLGPGGDGTHWPVYPLTPAGKTLLKRASKTIAPMQALSNEHSDANAKNDRNRKALFTEAEKQAKELFQEACKAWNLGKKRIAERQKCQAAS